MCSKRLQNSEQSHVRPTSEQTHPPTHPTNHPPSRAHVAAVRQLRHRKAAGQPEGPDVVKVPAAVRLRAQVEDAAAPQAVLHARLDHQAEVHQGEALWRLGGWLHGREGLVWLWCDGGVCFRSGARMWERDDGGPQLHIHRQQSTRINLQAAAAADGCMRAHALSTCEVEVLFVVAIKEGEGVDARLQQGAQLRAHQAAVLLCCVRVCVCACVRVCVCACVRVCVCACVRVVGEGIFLMGAVGMIREIWRWCATGGWREHPQLRGASTQVNCNQANASRRQGSPPGR